MHDAGCSNFIRYSCTVVAAARTGSLYVDPGSRVFRENMDLSSLLMVSGLISAVRKHLVSEGYYTDNHSGSSRLAMVKPLA